MSSRRIEAVTRASDSDSGEERSVFHTYIQREGGSGTGGTGVAPAGRGSSAPPSGCSISVPDVSGTTDVLATTPGSFHLSCVSLSMFALTCLVVQNCSAVLLMRYTQTRPEGEPYSIASLVISTELVKLFVCLVVMVWQSGVRGAIAEVLKSDGVWLGIPASCYTLQNNLLFVALANLEATLFQITYQLKVLITALFMVLMLGRRISMVKWMSLVLLFAGVVLTQLKATSSSKSDVTAQQLVSGLTAVVICSVSSAFASVYFEKVLKNAVSTLWARNAQLALWSTALALPVFMWEGRAWNQFFDGYDGVVCYLVFNQAAGGILVALVIKYADNILKGFATAVAIILSGVVSYMWLDFQPTFVFLCGATLVLTSVTVYSMPEKSAGSPTTNKL